MYGRGGGNSFCGSGWLFDNLGKSPVRCWSAADFEIFDKMGTLELNDKENIETEEPDSEQEWTKVVKRKQKKPLQPSSRIFVPHSPKGDSSVVSKISCKDPFTVDSEPTIVTKPISSYNWHLYQPILIVPGAPKLFYPWSGGQLFKINERMTVDEDTNRMSQAPLDPVIASVLVAQPQYKFEQLDVVGDLSTVKRLTRFLMQTFGDISTDKIKYSPLTEFRIDLELIGKVLMMIRREKYYSTVWSGYGAAYTKACTLESTDSLLRGPYKRITEVHLGGLRMLLRHKVLAAIYPEGVCQDSIGGSKRRRNVGKLEVLEHGPEGADPADYAMVELGSLFVARNLSVDKWIDMIMSGCDKFYLGHHREGWFPEPKFINREQVRLLSDIKDGKKVFYALESLLCQILTLVRSRSGKNRKFSLVAQNSDPSSKSGASLKLYEWSDSLAPCNSISKEFSTLFEK